MTAVDDANLVEKLRNYAGEVWFEGGTYSRICSAAADCIERLTRERAAVEGLRQGTVLVVAQLERERDALKARLAACERELDEASPWRQCARCGGKVRMHNLVAEEGDEWECFPCWERCNAQEQATLQATEIKIDSTNTGESKSE